MPAAEIAYDMTDGSSSFTDAAAAVHDLTGIVLDPSTARVTVDDQGRLLVTVGLVTDRLVITPDSGDPIIIDGRMLAALKRLGGL